MPPFPRGAFWRQISGRNIPGGVIGFHDGGFLDEPRLQNVPPVSLLLGGPLRVVPEEGGGLLGEGDVKPFLNPVQNPGWRISLSPKPQFAPKFSLWSARGQRSNPIALWH